MKKVVSPTVHSLVMAVTTVSIDERNATKCGLITANDCKQRFTLGRLCTSMYFQEHVISSQIKDELMLALSTLHINDWGKVGDRKLES